MDIRGIIAAVPTPFDEKGNLALGELERLLSFLVEARVDGVFVVGNAGEFYALDEGEKRAVLKTTVATVAGKVPVLFGAGAATTEESRRLAVMAAAEGADALSVITPYVIRPSDDELFAHYLGICAATALPVLPYNNPAVTGVSISPRLLKRLATIETIGGIKDSSGDFATTIEYLRVKKAGFSVLAGRDNLILSTLIHGGRGAMSSVASAVPEIAVSIYEAHVAGDAETALESQMKFARLRQMFSLGTFPAVIKAALELRGFHFGLPRAPVGPLSPEALEELAEGLREAGTI